MSNRFMMSVAVAALIVGTGFANAQGTGAARDAPSAGATTQQSPPSSAGAPMNRNDVPQSSAPTEGPKSTQSNEKMQPQGGKNQRAQDMKAGKGAADSKGGATNTAGSTTTDSKTMTTTTGQAAAGGKLSTEQRTQITTVIKSQHVQPVTNVSFSISVGTRVPRNVGFHPLPAQIVTIYPDWRGYEFFLVRDQIVVVNPRTLEIVAVIDA